MDRPMPITIKDDQSSLMDINEGRFTSREEELTMKRVDSQSYTFKVYAKIELITRHLRSEEVQLPHMI